MKSITLKELKTDRITYMERMVEVSEQLVQLQQQAEQVRISIYNLEGALAHVNQNIKNIEDAEEQRIKEAEKVKVEVNGS